MPDSVILDLPLTLEETLGVARRSEPITAGVPLPKGACTDPADLRLIDAEGRSIPAAFTAATRWWEDGSLKWVHVDLQRSLPAGGREVVRLQVASAGEADSGRPSLRVEESPSHFTVTTGRLRFCVNRGGFNLLDQVWLDGQEMLADRPRGAHVDQGSRTAWAQADAECTVSVEEANPFRVVLRAEGRHRLPDGSPLTDFITRLTAYAGQTYVRVSHAVLVRQGESNRDYLAVHNLGLALPLSLEPSASGLHYRFGGSEEVHEGDLIRAQAAFLHQHSVGGYAVYTDPDTLWTNWRMGTSIRGEGHSVRTGWVDLSDGARGVAVGVRDFWQLYPKVLQATAGGDVGLGLYPDQRFNEPLVLYPGSARTHELTISFHGLEEAEVVSDLMAAAQSPLTLLAPPKWYCRDTRAFGSLLEADPEAIVPEHRDVVAYYEQLLREGYEAILARRDSRAGLPRDVEEYGFLNYGDGFQHAWDGTAYWCDNYYDFPHALLLQFARTGRRDYLDHARAYGRHLGDLDISCYDPRPEVIGGARIAPSINHVRAYDDGEVKTSAAFCFLKNESLFELWYLTADRRFLESALLATQVAMAFDGAGADEPRTFGHAMICTLAAWEATGEAQYFARARYYVEKALQTQDELGGGFPHAYCFQAGLVGEGYWRWHQLTGDPEVAEHLVTLMDWLMETYQVPDKGFNDPTGYTAFPALGYATELTGDPRYLDFALLHARYWLPLGYGRGVVKDFGMAFRNSPYLLWWLQGRSR